MKTKLQYLAIAGAFILSSCEKEYYKPEAVVPVVPSGPAGPSGPSGNTGITGTISFSNDILPFFSNKGCQNCHPSSNEPDLSNANAYQALQGTSITTSHKGEKYIDTANPASSVLYIVIGSGDSMENYASITNNDRAKVLAWIQQGAQNN